MGKVRGTQDVKRNMRKIVGKITGTMTEKAVTKILIAGQAASDAITPIDSGNLINSKFREVKRTTTGYRGTTGYTAEYAKWVHEMSGKLKGQPRAHFGKTREGVEFGGGTGVGNYWDPNAEPKFLKKGFERDAADEIQQIIKSSYK